MRTTATILLLLALAAAPVAAEDDAPRAANVELGYSFPVTGLRRINLRPVDQTVLTAYLADDSDGSALFLERAAPNRRGSAGWLPRADEKNRGTGAIGDRPADAVSLGSGDRRLVRIAERAEKGEPFWTATLRLVGDPEQQAADERRLREALATFTTDLSTEKHSDDFEDRVFGFRIRLTGFEGPIQHFGFVVKEVYSFRIGERLIGTLTLILSPAEKDREGSLPEIRQRLERDGATIESVAETERSGRPAALFVSETGEGEDHRRDHRLVVWDGPRLFTLNVSLHPEEMEDGAEAAPLLAALEGFALADE